jgi:hypothetical protein
MSFKRPKGGEPVAAATAEQLEAVELPRYRTAQQLAPEMVAEIADEAEETYPGVIDVFTVFMEPAAT